MFTRTKAMEMEVRDPNGGWGRGTMRTGQWGLKPSIGCLKPNINRPEDKGPILYRGPNPKTVLAGVASDHLARLRWGKVAGTKAKPGFHRGTFKKYTVFCL